MRGPHDLGLFTMANEFATLPVNELVAPINRATFPGYSRLANDHSELRLTYLMVFGMVCMVAVPAAVGLFVTAHELVPVVLGAQWVEAVPLLQLIALGGGLFALTTNAGYLMIALGRPRRATLLSATYSLTLLATLVVSLARGVPNAAGWSILAAAVSALVATVFMLRTSLGIRWAQLLGSVWRPLVAAASMAATVATTRGTFELSPAVLLAWEVVLGALVYVAAVLALWYAAGCPKGAEKTMIDHVYPRACKALGARAETL
jgi:O-antigen/teichoic acid export membrane protein